MPRKFDARSWLVPTLALLFGLGFGLNYGSSNQVEYLLPAIRALHPNLWARDFFVTQTYNYHPAYAVVGALLLRLSPSGLGIAWANVVLIAVGMLCVYEVLRMCAGPERALPAFCVVLILSSVTRTNAPGSSYAFSEIFQPSTLGSVGMLAAAAAFIAGRPVVSGLCLVLGIFHINYLVLSLFVFGVGWLLSGRERLVPNMLAGLGPPLGVLICFAPFLLASADPSGSAEARQFYMDVRSPHHYRVPGFAWDFAFWAGLQCLGAAALLGPIKQGQPAPRRVLTLLLGFWALIVPAVLLSSIVVVPVIKHLFAWRISAEAEFLAEAAFAVTLVGVYRDGSGALVSYDRRARALAMVGVGALVLGSLATGKWTLTLVVLCLLSAALFVVRGILRERGSGDERGLARGHLTGALLITLVAVNVSRFFHLRRYSNVLSGGDPAVTGLCQWASVHTPEDALFLIPPLEEDLRFTCKRAVVVDWKWAPALPTEILAWRARLEDVTGRKPFRGPADLTGYDELDRARITKLRKQYGIDYVIVTRGHLLNLSVQPEYAMSRFAVYALSEHSSP